MTARRALSTEEFWAMMRRSKRRDVMQEPPGQLDSGVFARNFLTLTKPHTVTVDGRLVGLWVPYTDGTRAMAETATQLPLRTPGWVHTLSGSLAPEDVQRIRETHGDPASCPNCVRLPVTVRGVAR